MYSQRKADIPEASPIFASGTFCSSTRVAIDLRDSGEHDVGVEQRGLPNPGSANLILPIGHENSNAISLSWSFSVPSFSMGKQK